MKHGVQRAAQGSLLGSLFQMVVEFTAPHLELFYFPLSNMFHFLNERAREIQKIIIKQIKTKMQKPWG